MVAHEPWINHTCDDAMTSKFPPALILVTFTAAVFTSALLLFGVQPMFTRMVLPNLGGSPSVWSVAMVFFQTMLLAGYAYAHYLMKAKRSAVVVSVHLVLTIVAGLTLPFRSRAAGASRRRNGPRCGWSACSWCRSGCRSSRSRPTIRCCRPGSCVPAIRTARIPTSSTPPRMSAAFSRCCPTRSCWNRCCRCAPRPSCGPPAIGCCLRSSGRARSCWSVRRTRRGRSSAPKRCRRRVGPRSAAGCFSPPCRPACWSPSRRISRPTSRPRRSSGSFRSRSIS